jgi:hypothetical protein
MKQTKEKSSHGESVSFPQDVAIPFDDFWRLFSTRFTAMPDLDDDSSHVSKILLLFYFFCQVRILTFQTCLPCKGSFLPLLLAEDHVLGSRISPRILTSRIRIRLESLL